MKITQTPSPNQSGTLTPRYLMLHHTASTDFASTVAYLCKRTAMVSAHFVVGKKGEVAQLVPLTRKAWHAGVGKYGLIPRNQGNRYAIGIEIVNKGDGTDPYPAAQLKAIDALIAYLDAEVGPLPIIDHKMYAPKRKSDMSANFPLDTYRTYRRHTHGQVVPAKRVTHLYTSRSENARSLRTIPAGKTVRVFSKTAKWCYAEYVNQRGYIPTAHLDFEE